MRPISRRVPPLGSLAGPTLQPWSGCWKRGSASGVHGRAQRAQQVQRTQRVPDPASLRPGQAWQACNRPIAVCAECP